MSHLADRFFSEDQLDWINKHFRYSGRFLFTYGLKAYDDENCKGGVAIVRAMMGKNAEENGCKPASLRMGGLSLR